MSFSLYKNRVYTSSGTFTGTAGQNLQNSFTNLADELANHGFDVKQYGAKGDGQTVFDGAMTNTSTTLTSATANFTANDVGKSIYVAAAASGSADLMTTIAAFTNSTTVTLTAACGHTVSSAIVAWHTNDRVAIQNAINDACSVSGGVVFFPPGVYGVEGLQDTGTFNSILEIPITYLDQSPRSVALRGASASFDSNWPLSTQHPSQAGSVIRSMCTPFVSGNPAILASNQYNASTTGTHGTDFGFSFTGLSIFDLKFRQPNNPQLTCIQHDKGGPFRTDNVSCDVECVTSAVAQPSGTFQAKGIIMPNINNPAISDHGSIDVLGYYWGVYMGEHTNIKQVRCFACQNGLGYQPSGHGSYIARALLQWNVNHIRTTTSSSNKHFATISRLDCEEGPLGGGPSWGTTTADIWDENNLLNGSIRGRATSGGTTQKMIVQRALNIDILDEGVRTAGGALRGYPANVALSHGQSTVLVGGALSISGDAWFQTGSANGDSFQDQFVIEAGTYTVSIKGYTGSTRPIVDWYIDGSLISAGQDWYLASGSEVTKTFSSGTLSAGVHTLKAIVNGKNASSTGFAAFFNQFSLA